MKIIHWLQVNWICSIPLGLALIWAVCTFVESGAYRKAGLTGKKLPNKRLFSRTVLAAQALCVFFYLMWDCCGQLVWRLGWRNVLLAAFFLSLLLLAAASRSTWKRIHRAVRPASAAQGFYLRRWWGCAIGGWFWGFFPAALLQSVGLNGVNGTGRSLTRLFLGISLPLLFLWAVWIFSGPWHSDPNAKEEPEKETFSDRMIKLQIMDLIQERIREEEEENERRYREYWGDE